MTQLRRSKGSLHVDKATATSTTSLGRTTSLSLSHSPTKTIHLYDLPELVEAFAHVKQACARANGDLGLISADTAQAIIEATQTLLKGERHETFVLPVIAAGGGTASNMNANEAIAALAAESGTATEPVHPNNHVNRSQSSNDVYPTCLKIALHPVASAAAAELDRLAETYEMKAAEYATASRLGRTVWQDAVIVPIRDTHHGHAAAMRRLADGLRFATASLLKVQLGGTVLGTGAGAAEAFADSAIAHLATATGLDIRPNDDLVDAFAHSDTFAAVADAAARAGAILFKLSHDLRILSSGPHAGLGELTLPAIQPGSSIMPGKVNPVVPNMVAQTSFGIRSAAYAVSMIVSAGEPDINVNGPAIAANLYPALHQLRESTAILNDSCVSGLTWNSARLEYYKDGSYEELIDMSASVGYDEAARHGRSGDR